MDAAAQSKPQAWPLTQQAGESYDDFMQRAITRAKQLTPQEMSQAEANVRDPKKIGTVLGAAALAGPALLTSGAIAPEAASTAVGGGIPGAIAGGATGGGLGTATVEPFMGVNPLSREGATEIGKQTLYGGLTGGLLEAGGRLVGNVAKNAPQWWDAVTGYRKALDEAKNANLARYRQVEQTAQEAVTAGQQKVEAVRASYPQGQEGNWAKTNEILGVPQRALRIGQNADRTFGNAGRGLEAEGFGADQLQTMLPPDQVRAITPRWQAAGKAVQGTADQATANGVTLDAGKQAHEVIKGIKDPQQQEKAIELFNQHTRDLDIPDVRNMTPTEALKLRQALRNDANFNAMQPGIGTKLYRAVSQDLHGAVPELVPVDEHYGDLTTALNAAQKNTSKYLIGKYTPPQTRLQKAEAAVPQLPNSSPYTPLPSSSPFNRAAATKVGAAAGLGSALTGGFYGLSSLLKSTP